MYQGREFVLFSPLVAQRYAQQSCVPYPYVVEHCFRICAVAGLQHGGDSQQLAVDTPFDLLRFALIGVHSAVRAFRFRVASLQLHARLQIGKLLFQERYLRGSLVVPRAVFDRLVTVACSGLRLLVPLDPSEQSVSAFLVAASHVTSFRVVC